MQTLTDKPVVNHLLSDLTFDLASKTRPIKAKALSSLLMSVNESILAKFLLDTLEGKQTLKASSMVCLAEAGEVWQQTSAKLLQKYTVVGIDPEGWLECQPKPENKVMAAVISENICGPSGFSLFAQWGEEKIINGKQCFVQHGVAGDYVLKSTSDPSDLWIVKGKLFESTYQWI